jgi:Protein of unknown function (DUF3592)
MLRIATGRLHMDALFEYLLKALVYASRVIIRWPKVIGSGQWLLANAAVTAPPTRLSGIGCPRVEIVYSYRVKGELYTGLHEEPFMSTDSVTEYIERFAEGRSVVVRVKPASPEVSVVREDDQGVVTQSELEQPLL